VGPEIRDASRRTYLAEERTLLAWWRSGLAAFAVAIGVGRLLPALLDDPGRGPFVALGVAYALLGLTLVLSSAPSGNGRRRRRLPRADSLLYRARS